MAKKNNTKNSAVVVVKLFVVLSIVVLLVLAWQRSVYSLQHSDLFKVREIKTAPSLSYINSPALLRLKGKSIFSADLLFIHRRLQSQYPEIDQLRIVRKFPDTVYVVARKRDPMAYLSLNNRAAVLDKEGVVLAFQRLSESKVPAITGVRLAQMPSLGSKVRFKGLEAAMDIVENYQASPRLAAYPIVAVDVNNLSRILLTLGNNLQVIIDHEQLEEKMKKLNFMLAQQNLNFNEIKYIDLRFQEPILGKKEEPSRR